MPGNLADQNRQDVLIEGGTITGITDLAIADGGTGASTAAQARANLGITSLSSPVAIAEGGTGATTATGARTNLDAQASSSVLTAYAAGPTPTPAFLTLVDDTTVGAIRTTLGVGTTDTPTFVGVNLGDENLDHYDEGSWTPVLAGSSTAGSQTYGNGQVGRYVRVGNLVHVWGFIGLSAKDAATAGDMRITGLPFTVSNVVGMGLGPTSAINDNASWDLNVAGGYYSMFGAARPNTTRIDLLEGGDNVSAANLTSADFAATSRVFVNMFYTTGLT